jgi:hypothetical protein
MASRRLLLVEAVDAMVVRVVWALDAFRFESVCALLLPLLWCRWYGVVDDVEDASALVMVCNSRSWSKKVFHWPSFGVRNASAGLRSENSTCPARPDLERIVEPARCVSLHFELPHASFKK